MQKMRSAATVATIAMAVLFTAAPAHAQAPVQTADKTRGLVFGAHLNGTSIAYEDEDTQTGGGGGVMVGWGFNKRFMLYTNLDVVKLNFNLGIDCPFECEDEDDFLTEKGDFAFVHGDIGVRFSFPSANHGWVPYLNAALTVRSAAADFSDDIEVSLSGGALTAGAGVQYFFNQKFALDAGLMLSAGELKNFKVKSGGFSYEDDNFFDDIGNVNTFRLNVGVKYYPHFGGR